MQVLENDKHILRIICGHHALLRELTYRAVPGVPLIEPRAASRSLQLPFFYPTYICGGTYVER